MEPEPTDRPDETEPTPDVVERAAEWLAHLESGDASAAEVAEYERWRGEHPAHALAMDRLGGLSARLQDGTDIERETLRRLFLRPPQRAGGVLLGLIGLVGAGWLIATLPSVQIFLADQRTAAGETRSVPLSDGSRIVLATNSAANVEDKPDHRSVRLLRGELLAEVARPRHEPFVVKTRDGTAEAMGTAFTVRKNDDATVVAVISSRVRACPAQAGPDACVSLTAGERALLRNGVATSLTPVVPTDVAAWAEGWLPVDDQPLDEVLDDLNRWRGRPVQFDRGALADLRVSGVFPLRDTDRALDNLSRTLPIVLDRSDPTSPVVRRK